MSWTNAASSWIGGSKNLSETPTINETLRETADSLLAKQAKIDLAMSALNVDDLSRMQDAQRESIRRYQELKVFGNRTPPADPPKPEDSDVPRIIVCDDYRVDSSTRPDPSPAASNKLPIAAAIVAAAIAGYALFGDRGEPAPEPSNLPAAPASVEDTDTRYDLLFID